MEYLQLAVMSEVSWKLLQISNYKVFLVNLMQFVRCIWFAWNSMVLQSWYPHTLEFLLNLQQISFLHITFLPYIIRFTNWTERLQIMEHSVLTWTQYVTSMSVFWLIVLYLLVASCSRATKSQLVLLVRTEDRTVSSNDTQNRVSPREIVLWY